LSENVDGWRAVVEEKSGRLKGEKLLKQLNKYKLNMWK